MSTRTYRDAARRSQARSTDRRRRPPPKGGSRRRWLVIGGTFLAFGIAGFAAYNTDEIQDVIREVTLPLKHEDIIRQESKQHGVQPELVAAVIYAESRFRDQTSSAGARGLMQITPETAADIEEESGGSTFTPEDLSSPDHNIAYGTFWLGYLLEVYEGNEVAAIAAYNAGRTNVAKWGGVDLGREDIEFADTRDYVDEVFEKRDDYRRHYSEELGL